MSQLALIALEALDQPVVVSDAGGQIAVINAAARQLLGLGDEPAQDLVGWERWQLERDGGLESMSLHETLRRAVGGDELLRGPARLVLDDDVARPVQVSTAALKNSAFVTIGALLRIDGVLETDADTEVLRRYASDMAMLDAVSQPLAELQDPDEAASVICTIAAGMTGAITILLWELTGDDLAIRSVESGSSAEELAETTARTHEAATRAVTQTQTVIERVPPTAVAGAGHTPAGDSTVWHEPLAVGDRVFGVLSIIWDVVLTDLERPGLLIRSLAEHAATALERTALLNQLHLAVRTDGLTGVANRRSWEESLARELARSRRDGTPLSAVLIDIDHFKAYNDEHGHPMGDQLLIRAAHQWSKQLRPTDLLARVGGEEFAALLPCPLDYARTIAERLRVAMPDGQTCSLGVVTWDRQATATEFYALADAALYQAKRDGRNRVRVAPSPATD